MNLVFLKFRMNIKYDIKTTKITRAAAPICTGWFR